MKAREPSTFSKDWKPAGPCFPSLGRFHGIFSKAWNFEDENEDDDEDDFQGLENTVKR